MGRKKRKTEPESPRAEQEWLTWEPDWLSESDPEQLCKILGGLEDRAGVYISHRKWRLFMVACLRRVMHVFRDERHRTEVEVIEQRAEGLLTDEEFYRGWDQPVDPPSPDAVGEPDVCPPEVRPVACANQAMAFASNARPIYFDAYTAAGWAQGAADQPETERLFQVSLLRDIFGNPFRPASVDSSWLTWNGGTVRKLAQVIYAERKFDDLPILADALEDAGCDNADILEHCRGGGPHVRGCWVLDLLLDKE